MTNLKKTLSIGLILAAAGILGACNEGTSDEDAGDMATEQDVAPADEGGAEETPPARSIAVASPSPDAVLTGSLTITLAASPTPDKIEVYVDGAKLGEAALPAMEYALDTTARTDGSHAIMARGFWGDDSIDSAAVGVKIDNDDPAIGALAFEKYDILRDYSVAVPVTASDEAGLAKVEVLVNGVVAAAATADPFTPVIDARTAENGVVALSARATDLAGHEATTAEVTVVLIGNGGIIVPDEGVAGTDWQTWQMQIPAAAPLGEVDTKFHWDMPENVVRIYAIAVVTSTGDDWTSGFHLGMGWCPDSGTTLEALTTDEKEAVLKFEASERSLTTFVSGDQWFFHQSPVNAAEHMGGLFKGDYLLVLVYG